jgi:phosphonatase-like hydrolase
MSCEEQKETLYSPEDALKLSRRSTLKTLAAATLQSTAAEAATSTKRDRNSPAIRLIVLDVGGTIIEDRGDVPATLQSAMGKNGVTVTPAEISEWRGASKREIIRHFVERQTMPAGTDREKLVTAIYQDFNARLGEIYRTVPPIAGAEDAIRKLRQSGYLLATTTGFDREITIPIFHRLGWEKYFAAIICSDDVAMGRPAPFMLFHAMESARVNSVAEVMAVGDTPLDLQAGTNAGLRAVVGVLSGASRAELLQREPHTHILPSVANLPSLLPSKV